MPGDVASLSVVAVVQGFHLPHSAVTLLFVAGALVGLVVWRRVKRRVGRR